MLGPAGFLQAWLAGGLREQVLACVGDLLQELEPDQLYNAADRQAACPSQIATSLCELCLTFGRHTLILNLLS